MIRREWRRQCRRMLEIDQPDDTAQQPFNLWFPAAYCPKCDYSLKRWQNIPALGYLLLGAKCGFCKATIPLRYPLIELITAAATAHLFIHFGAGWSAIASMFLVWSLICLIVIDIEHQLLPDSLTLPLVWVGLLANFFGLFTTLESAVLGAVVGYLSFWLIFQIYHYITGRAGLGYGDFKLLAALGAWLGWESLPAIVLLSSLGGILFVLAMMFGGKLNQRLHLSFGPFLAIAGWVSLLWGQQLPFRYLRLFDF